MTNKQKNTNGNKGKVYDLEERTALFGENVIKLLMKVPSNSITNPIKNQLTKSATSVGANYCEADDAVSKKDFKNKIGICKKESRESKHFLRMLAVAYPPVKEEAKTLWLEAKELNLIFNSIYKKVS